MGITVDRVSGVIAPNANATGAAGSPLEISTGAPAVAPLGPAPTSNVAETLPAAALARAATARVVVLRPLGLSSSVGRRGANRTLDVRRVQQRLQELGYPVTADGRYGPQTRRAIALFVSIVTGRDSLLVSDRLTPGSGLVRMLAAPDAPRWVEVPESGTGWRSVDTDGYGWATDRTLDVIEAAGHSFEAYRLAHDTQPLMINDVSRSNGSMLIRNGRHEHETHRNGLDIDLRLPRTDGTLGGTQTHWRSYDRAATYAMVEAFAAQPEVEAVRLYDATMLAWAKRDGKAWAHKLILDRGHRDHIHVDVAAPVISTT